MREKPSTQIGHNSKPRSLDVIANDLHALERNAFDKGALLLEARAVCEHGEWYAWLDREFAWSVDTAARYIAAANLAAKYRTVRDLKVPMRVIYDLAADNDVEDPDLPAIIEALAKASKSKKLSVADADEVVETTRLRIQFGDYPPATLWALDRVNLPHEWAKQASEKLKELRPTTEEQADQIIEAYRPPWPEPEPEPEEIEPDEPKVEEKSEEGEAAAPEESTENAEGEDEEDEAPASLAAEKARIIKAWDEISSGARIEFVRERWDQIFMAHAQLLAVAESGPAATDTIN
jgi:hypothetical protein